MAEYVGVLIVPGLAALLIGGLLVLHRALAPVAEHEVDPVEARPRPAGRRMAIGGFVVVLLFPVISAAGVVVYLWAPVFRELGRTGLIGLLVFVVPVCVGYLHCWRGGEIRW